MTLSEAETSMWKINLTSEIKNRGMDNVGITVVERSRNDTSYGHRRFLPHVKTSKVINQSEVSFLISRTRRRLTYAKHYYFF